MNSRRLVIPTVRSAGVEPGETELYFTAFTHQSYANEHNVESNERLEYLGDAVLNFLVAEYLYLRFPDMPEGALTKTRAKFVCATANSRYALALRLNEAIMLGKGEAEQGGMRKASVLGDLFEAFLGAVYLDKGLSAVKEILERIVFPYIDSSEPGFFIDYKSRLQELIQSESRRNVEYVLDKETGPPHDKRFFVSVYHNGKKLGTGSGKTKKAAEQNAAETALKKLM
ncbi:MAG TPA: ribonuclease III [Bacilli bacterium]|nr:ribonuclease III [Bacilli bacterium]HPZ26855.1 ribonuclease III [Bacilli bacterium]HQC89156.1 ribonuclease III [Bacilli bacterium]